jgi:hypothetical protein
LRSSINMSSQHVLRGFLAFTMLVAVAACSSLPTSPPRDLLDEHTGATVTVVGAPIQFARPPNGDAYQDVVTLVAIQKDNDGKYTDLLLIHHWSVSPGAASPSPDQRLEELQIQIDGHAMQLQPLPRLPDGLPKPKDLFVPDAKEAAMRAYVTDLATLRLIATSHELTVSLPQDSLNAPFMLWHDGRPALAQFVEHLSGP